jgi:hypothetical protein
VFLILPFKCKRNSYSTSLINGKYFPTSSVDFIWATGKMVVVGEHHGKFCE